jgi:hypothetical protein
MKPLLLAALTAVLAGCTAGSDTAQEDAVSSPPQVSRNAHGDCVAAWNALGNMRNRLIVASKHTGWSLEVTDVQVSTGGGRDAELTGEGCGYFLHSRTHWASFSGMWERDGDLRWAGNRLGGARTDDQLMRSPNATVLADGRIAALGSRQRPVDAAAWRAVIDDWYVDGVIDGIHACDAVQAAIEMLPQDVRNFSSATGDLRAYADRVC